MLNTNLRMPRRIDTTLMVPAETAIADAVFAVERMGAHPVLTTAVNLLAEAKKLVADYTDARLTNTMSELPKDLNYKVIINNID